MALHLVASHRLEDIAADLAARINLGRSPLDEDVVVVQNLGLAVWLEQRLSRLNGVSFLNKYPLPRRFFAGLFAELAKGRALDPRFERETLAWRIDGALASLADRPLDGGESVARYLASDVSGARRAGLADRIAAVFDDYLAFRPDLVLAWESGADWDLEGEEHPAGARWQAELWRRLTLPAEGAEPPLLIARAM
jgi:exodeoxyribonuclease V gamma subunit